MALSDAKKNKRSKAVRRSKSSPAKTWYSDAQKLEAVKAFLLTGSHTQTAAVLNINPATLRTWRQSDWWKELVADIKQEGSMTLTHRLKKMADRALEVTEDRLENGDFFFNNKTGEVERRGVSMRDAHRVAVDLLKQADTIENRPIGEVATEESVDAKLEHLAEKFMQIANKAKKPTVEVTDVIFAEETKDTNEES